LTRKGVNEKLPGTSKPETWSLNMFTEAMKGSKPFCNFPVHWFSIISESVGSLNVYFLTDKFQSRKFVYNKFLTQNSFFYSNSVSSNSVTRTGQGAAAAATDDVMVKYKNDSRNLNKKSLIGNVS
jgi:hypothetical protein